jgi:enterochelin esterase-like enzyme
VTMKRLAILCLLALAGCGPKSNRLEKATVPAGALGRTMEMSILRPPPGPDDANLPVVYLLHGVFDDHTSLDRTGLSDFFHEAMEQGRVPRAYLVMPEGERGFYINWHDGTRRYEDYLMHEVIPSAEKALGIAPTRERRHMAGVSMGGLGTLQAALRHPELLESAACLSGLILDEKAAVEYVNDSIWARLFDMKAIFGDGSDKAFFEGHNPYPLVRARGKDLGFRLFLAAGETDTDDVKRTSIAFHDFLVRRGVAHEWELYKGGHRWTDWAPVLERALRFMLGGKPAS